MCPSIYRLEPPAIPWAAQSSLQETRMLSPPLTASTCTWVTLVKAHGHTALPDTSSPHWLPVQALEPGPLSQAAQPGPHLQALGFPLLALPSPLQAMAGQEGSPQPQTSLPLILL